MDMGYGSELARQRLDGFHRDAEIARMAFNRSDGPRSERRRSGLVPARVGRGLWWVIGPRKVIA